MKIKTLIAILLFLIFLITPYRLVKADLYVPPYPCDSNEIFFDKNDIDPNLYEKIIKVSSDTPHVREGSSGRYFYSDDYDGYCVDLDEYCRKNECDESLLIYKYHDSIDALPGLDKNNPLIINFIINTILILIILKFSDIKARQFIRLKYLLLIPLITLLGYLADILGLYLSLSLLEFLGTHAFQFIKYIPPTFLYLTVGTFLIFIMVYIIFYIVFARDMFYKREMRIKASVFYAAISNPIWIFLFRMLVN